MRGSSGSHLVRSWKGGAVQGHVWPPLPHSASTSTLTSTAPHHDLTAPSSPRIQSATSYPNTLLTFTAPLPLRSLVSSSGSGTTTASRPTRARRSTSRTSSPSSRRRPPRSPSSPASRPSTSRSPRTTCSRRSLPTTLASSSPQTSSATSTAAPSPARPASKLSLALTTSDAVTFNKLKLCKYSNRLCMYG